MTLTFDFPIKPIYDINGDEDGYETESYEYEPTDEETAQAVAECFMEDNPSVSFAKAFETINSDVSYFEELCNKNDLKDILLTNCYDSAYRQYLEEKE